MPVIHNIFSTTKGFLNQGLEYLKFTTGADSSILKITNLSDNFTNSPKVYFLMPDATSNGKYAEMFLEAAVLMDLTGATWGLTGNTTDVKLYIYRINCTNELRWGISDVLTKETVGTFSSTASSITASGNMYVNDATDLQVGTLCESIGYITADFTLSGAEWVIDATVGTARNFVTVPMAQIQENVASTGENVGTGADVFKEKVGNTLKFRTIKNGTGITVTENTNDVEISSTATGGWKSINNFVFEPTTNNTFSSSGSNNPYGLKFDDLKPRFGIERILFAGLECIPENDGQSYDSNGLRGYYPINSKTGKVDKRIRFYGSWVWYDPASVYGIYKRQIRTDVANDYFVVTGVLNKINVISVANASASRVSDSLIYLNGTSTGNYLSQIGSLVIAGAKSSTVTQPQNLNIGSISVGINTVKVVAGTLVASTKYLVLEGMEISNDGYAANQEITIPSGTEVIKGVETAFTAKTGSGSLPYKGVSNGLIGSELYSGTKGARVVWYRDENGNYISKVQTIEEQTQSAKATYNSTSSDSITSLADSSKYYANSQGNIIRVKDATSSDKLLLVPTAAPSATEITAANDFDGVADTTLFAGNKQFRDDATTGSTFADDEDITVELYGKVLANTDHSNEEAVRDIQEAVRDIHWRDFGTGDSTDFSTLQATGSDRMYTLEDGITNLVGACNNNNGLLIQNTTNDFIVFTFCGSGLDIVTTIGASHGGACYIDGVYVIGDSAWAANKEIVNLCSDLPYGTHTVKLVRSTYYMRIHSFIVYQPKTKAIEGYKPEFAYNVLANQVLTSLPTRSLSAYNGHIDAGVLRKVGQKEFFYSGTWTYGSIQKNACGGLSGPYSSDTSSDVAITFFGEGRFRIQGFDEATGDQGDIELDGSKVEDLSWDSASTFGSLCTSNMNIGTAGVHTVKIFIDAANRWYNHAIDYHTPIHEYAQWRTNPFFGYLIGSTALGVYQKDRAEDEKLVQREIIAYDNLTVNEILGSSEFHIAGCTLVLEQGTWLIEGLAYINKRTTDNHDIKILQRLDGVASSYTYQILPTLDARQPISCNKIMILPRRTAVLLYIYTPYSSTYTYEYDPDSYILARKISE